MKPQDYSARTAYRPSATWYRRLNRIGIVLTSLGWAPRDAVTLEVRGRVSGRPRRVPILRTRHDGQDYLVSLAGQSQWVKNLRAANGEGVIHRRGARRIRAVEVEPQDAADIIAAYLRAGRARSGAQGGLKQARYYFGLDAEPSLEDIRGVTEYYPVFRIEYLR